MWLLIVLALAVGVGAASSSRVGLTFGAVRISLDGGSPFLVEVRRELDAMKTSGYQHDTDVDETAREFNYDCSGFLDYALEKSHPDALRALPLSKSERPLAQDYVHEFQRVAGRTAPDGPWRTVSSIPTLRAGDVIAWLAPADSKTKNTGHVVVVLEPPVRNPARADEWLVRIADSTSSPHAADSRVDGADGLGTGTIGLRVGDGDVPIGYYWRGGVSTVAKHTEVAFGRLP